MGLTSALTRADDIIGKRTVEVATVCAIDTRTCQARRTNWTESVSIRTPVALKPAAATALPSEFCGEYQYGRCLRADGASVSPSMSSISPNVIDIASTSSAPRYLRGRWKAGGTLFRAGQAVLADFERRGIDPGRVHLHGQDVRDEDTPYFAGIGLKYLKAAPRCLVDWDGEEWIEVVHPTLRGELHALRILPLDRKRLAALQW
jgi:hypothetical protein